MRCSRRSMPRALGGAVAHTPGTAVAFDQRRKRPLPARLEYAREQRLVAVADVFDVLHVELMGSGFEHCSRHGQAPVSEDRASLSFAQCGPDRNVPHARLSHVDSASRKVRNTPDPSRKRNGMTKSLRGADIVAGGRGDCAGHRRAGPCQRGRCSVHGARGGVVESKAIVWPDTRTSAAPTPVVCAENQILQHW